MLFGSFRFLLFFIFVFAIYYLPPVRKSVNLQNWWLLLSSYFFYGYADIRMLPLLIGATLAYYGIGRWLYKAIKEGRTRTASWITFGGILLGIGVLVYFKYLGFFADSIGSLLKGLGFAVSWSTLHIVMPVGVSFFTFKLIGYIIEIRREHIEPCKDLVKFGTFVAFFPTVLSGPIDRPNQFLPQLDNSRLFDGDFARDGASQLLWGAFTKFCVADNLALLTDGVWGDYASYSACTLFLSILLYPIQMYADFDGYSNMAIGVGKLLGIKITRNFNHPFLSRNIAEYWRHWHMSLTCWCSDYIFTPLNIRFRTLGKAGVILATLINFLLIGFWHGADWTFGLFGLYHGLLYIPLIISGTYAKNKKLKAGRWSLPAGKDTWRMLVTFLLVAIGLILFRASSLSEVVGYLSHMAGVSLLDFSVTAFEVTRLYGSSVIFLVVLLFTLLLLLVEWLCRNKEHALQNTKEKTMPNKKKYWRWIAFVALSFCVLVFKGETARFIYFQF